MEGVGADASFFISISRSGVAKAAFFLGDSEVVVAIIMKLQFVSKEALCEYTMLESEMVIDWLIGCFGIEWMILKGNSADNETWQTAKIGGSLGSLI